MTSEPIKQKLSAIQVLPPHEAGRALGEVWREIGNLPQRAMSAVSKSLKPYVGQSTIPYILNGKMTGSKEQIAVLCSILQQPSRVRAVDVVYKRGPLQPRRAEQASRGVTKVKAFASTTPPPLGSRTTRENSALPARSASASARLNRRKQTNPRPSPTE